jgi:hypothetical protein
LGEKQNPLRLKSAATVFSFLSDASASRNADADWLWQFLLSKHRELSAIGRGRKEEVMRSFIVTLMLILVPLVVSWGGQYDYTGEIVFDDTTTAEYTRLRVLVSESKEDILPYSKDIQDFKGSASELSSLRVPGIARIDFLDFTDSEKREKDHLKFPGTLRKAKVTFRDGAVYDNVYLDCTQGHWGSDRESGWLGSDKIKSITVKLKGAKQCPKCSRQFKEADWKYCPFCGTALK